jgi:hypothetical protein
LNFLHFNLDVLLNWQTAACCFVVVFCFFKGFDLSAIGAPWCERPAAGGTSKMGERETPFTTKP